MLCSKWVPHAKPLVVCVPYNFRFSNRQTTRSPNIAPFPSMQKQKREEKEHNVEASIIDSVDRVKPSPTHTHTGARRRNKFYTCTPSRYLIRATNVTGVGGLGRAEAYGMWIYIYIFMKRISGISRYNIESIATKLFPNSRMPSFASPSTSSQTN